MARRKLLASGRIHERVRGREVLAALAAALVIAGEIATGTARAVVAALRRAWPPVQRQTARAVAAGHEVWPPIRDRAVRVRARAHQAWPPARDRLVRGAAATWVVFVMGATMLAWALRRGVAGLADMLGAAIQVVRTAAAEGAGRVRRWSSRPRLLREPAPRPASPAGWAARLASVVGVGALAVAVVAVAAGFLVRFSVAAAASSVESAGEPVSLPPLPQRSVVFAADNSPTAVLHGDQDRQPVRLDQIAPVAVNAVIDTEDDRFWQHGGIDPHGVLRALTRDVSSGTVDQGGSTITQQLVKNALLTPKRSLGRKLTEMILATRIEQRYGKPAVLERYLNTVYFGEGAYGIESAAEAYFGTYAANLTAAQAALLAGIIQDPTGHDPLHNPAGAAARRHAVLDLMVVHHHLSPADAATADRQPVPTQVARFPQVRDFFTEAVRQELLADPRLGPTVEARSKALLTGGLQIHTTLDRRLQQEAEGAVRAGIPQGSMPLSAALASVDPATGAIRAVVGGASFGASQYDAALGGSGRQPGSSFKVFTLVTALQQGMSPAAIVDGSTPCSIPNPGGTPNPWQPSNFEGEMFGTMTLSDATAHSVNCAYARLALAVGLGNVAQTAHAMGITAHLNVVPSMTLGTNDVTPLQMASAYATLAADGVYHQPHLVDQVDRPDGSVLLRNAVVAKRVMPAQIAREATQVLQQVVTSGTGTAAAVPGRQIAGKTGTAENYQDAWFVGYAPNLATAVWMGDPAGERPMRGVGGIDVVGGSYPARIWSAYMTEALAPFPAETFPAPDPTAPGPPSVTPPTAPSTTTRPTVVRRRPKG